MSPEMLQAFRQVARDAARRLRYHAEVGIESFEAPGRPPEEQDRFWHEAQGDLTLAKTLARYAQHGKRIGKRT